MTKQKAYVWLQKKLQKYGNTCWFPANDKVRLNSYIEKFGNTYFWNR